MSISSDGVEVDDSWRVDLEIALLEDADFFKIRTICANRPVPANTRAEVWRICLQPELQAQGMTDFSDVFGLKNQHQLHADCEQAAKEAIDQLQNAHSSSSEHHTAPAGRTTFSDSETDELESPGLLDDDHKFDFGRDPEPNHIPSVAQLTSDFESVLTHFAQTYSLDYSSDNGWISILRVLYCTLKPVDKHDLYACFAAVYHRFVPNGPDVARRTCLVFRLLFQYHEPELCNLLESLKITPDLYTRSWFFHLFTTAISHAALVALWDVYFLMADPLLGLFIALVLLINAKASLIDAPESGEVNKTLGSSDLSQEQKPHRTLDKDAVLQMLKNLPKPMEANDITSLIELTQLFADRTPHSFRAEFLPILFGNTVPEDEDVQDGQPSLPSGHHLCLPVSVQEVLEAQTSALKCTQNHALGEPASSASATTEPMPPIRFLLVDCRPADQYNAGHLTTAFFIDSQLLLSDPDSFQTTIDALLQSQRRALNAGSYAAGEHITFLSSGRPEEDQITNMVVAAFLRLNTPYVSLIKGGYAALHEALDPELMGRSLINHDTKECLSCRSYASKKDSMVTSLLKSNTKFAKKDTNPKLNQPQSILKTSSTGGRFFSKLSGTLFKGTVGAVTGNDSQAKTPRVSGTEKCVSTSMLVPATVTPQSAIRSSGSGVLPKRLIAAEADRPTSYRNTASVFSIDDDEVDDDDVAQLDGASIIEDGEPWKESATTTEIKTTEQSSSKQTSWLKRFAAVMNVSETDTLPSGDIPTRSGGLDSSEPGDMIDTTQWSCRPEVHGVFECQFIDLYGRLADVGYLVLAERHLLVLRDRTPRSPVRLVASIGSAIQSALGRGAVANSQGTRITTRSRHAVVLRSAPLALITRITSNRRLPECITFHYSDADPADSLRLNEQVMGIRDRLYLPQAGEAVRMIKQAIYHVTMA